VANPASQHVAWSVRQAAVLRRYRLLVLSVSGFLGPRRVAFEGLDGMPPRRRFDTRPPAPGRPDRSSPGFARATSNCLQDHARQLVAQHHAVGLEGEARRPEAGSVEALNRTIMAARWKPVVLASRRAGPALERSQVHGLRAFHNLNAFKPRRAVRNSFCPRWLGVL
jgi:hypothetical protein